MRNGLAAILLLSGRLATAGDFEVGVENYHYFTAATALNRDDVLGLGAGEARLRGLLHWRESRGELRLVFRGYVERTLGTRDDETDGVVRQAYAQYGWGPGLSVRAGKQRAAWGSGFAWNPTNRIEPPKNPLNTGLEQEGAWAARLDWAPTEWVGVVLLAARGEPRGGDLPFEAPAAQRRTAALRARFLVADTDAAFVFSGGAGQRTLLGFDLGRSFGSIAAHAEGAFYRGAELPPAREDETFLRVAAGALWARDTTSVALEYFFNGEGYDADERDAYLAALEAAFARTADPRLTPAERERALAAYLERVFLPYSGGMGLRRHYLHASWTRAEIRGEWTLALRAVAGLEDGGVALTPGLAFAPRGDLTLHLDAVVLLGSERSEYRLAPLRGALQARARFLF